jgi:hypothetical protein
MVGRAIVRDLNSKGYVNVHEVTRNIVDLTNQNMVNSLVLIQIDLKCFFMCS